MKPFAKILLATSLLVNLALALVLISGGLSNRPAATTTSPAGAAQPSAAPGSVQAPGLWSKWQADDLPTFVAHLRSAGVPANLIRAIVAAQIREQFAARRKAIEGAPERAYWKSPAIDPKQQQALRELSREQDKILRDLLGADAEASDGFGLAYRDRGLSGLPAAKADQVRQILRDFDQQRQDMYSSIVLGGVISFNPADRDKLKAIDAAQRAEIAKVLTPAELENYELMASNTAQSLRYQLSAFNATEDEFRTLYKLQKGFDDQMSNTSYGMPSSPEQMRARSDAQKQLNEQIELALGPQRYADYQRATDYNYRQTTLLVARLELPPDTANQLYTVQKDYQQRIMETRMNGMSGGADLTQQLTALQQEAIAKVTPILGSGEAVEAYKQYGGSWITNMVPRMPIRRAGVPATAAPAPTPKT